MRARLTNQQYSAFVNVPFEIIVQVQNDEETIKEVSARPGLIPSDAWVSRPLVVSLFPGETADIQLEVRLPRETPAGINRIPIEIRDENGPVGTLNAEVNVAPFDDLTVSVSPKVVVGGSKTAFVVTTTNPGNRPTGVSVTAGDADRALKFTVEPRRAQLEAGQAVAFRVDAKGRRPFVGNSLPRAIQLDIASRSTTSSETVTFTQKPRLSRGLITILVLLSIIVLWAVVFSAGFKAALAGQQPKKAVHKEWVKGAKPDPSISIGSISAHIIAASDSRPIPRVILTATPLTGGKAPTAGSSDEDGAVTLSGLSPGTYKLDVSGDGYVSQSLPDTIRVVPSEEPIALKDDILLVGNPGTMNGQISAGEVPPIVNIEARLVVGDVPSDTAITGASDTTGIFSIANLPTPGRFRLTFTAQGFEPIQLYQELAAGETITMPTVKMQAGPGSITGLVLDQSGLPLGGVAITATAGADAVSTVTPTTGDDLGRFTLPELKSPATYLMQVSLEGYGTQTLTVKVGPGESVTLPTSIVLSKGTGVIRGAVTDATGTALGGVSVVASNGAVAGQTVTVDSGGFYSLSGLAVPGTYVLTFSKDGYTTEVVGVSLSSGLGASTVDVQLVKSLSSITGTVVSATTSQALPGATVIATSAVGTLTTLSTDPTGAFRIDGLANGWWTITATLAGYTDNVLLVQINSADQSLGTVSLKAQ